MRVLIGTLSLLLAVSFTAQAGDKALLGALIGAAGGAAVGHSVDRTGGSGKGAAIGAVGGYVLGTVLEGQEGQAAETASTPVSQTTSQTTSRAASQTASTTVTAFRQDCSLALDYFQRGYDASSNVDKIYYLQKGLQHCETDVQAQNDLGAAYYQRGGRHDIDRARDQFRAALRLDPNYSSARQNLNSL